MQLIIIAAYFAACYAAKLDRSYLPPESAKPAGGTSEILQTPFRFAAQTSQQNIPPGSFVNEFDGVVIDADAAGTRATHSGLGGSRISYGSTDSKVGEAAFKDTTNLNQNNQAPHPNSVNLPNVSGFRQPIIQPGEEVPSDQMPVLEQERFHAARDRASNIITYQNDIGIKDFNYAYQTDNGISAAENGIAVNGVRSQGGYSYTGDDGQVYTVSYTADEGGYRPQGAHLPTPPPIPVEILKALEQNAKDEAAGIVDDGSYDAQKYNTEDTKGNSANDYNDRQYNTFEKGPGFNGPITTTSQNSQAPSKPNDYQDLTNPSQNNGLQSNQFISNANNFEYTGNDKQSSNFSTNGQQQNGFDSSVINYGSIDKNQLPFPNSQALEDLNTSTQINTQFSVDNNKQQSFNIPLSQQKLQDREENLDSLSGRPSSYEAPISGSIQGQQQTNNVPSVYPSQFNKANANEQSQQTFNPSVTSSQFLNTNSQSVSANNNAHSNLASPFPSSISGSSHFGGFSYQPIQQFGIASPVSSANAVFSQTNENAEQNQNRIGFTSASSQQNNENRFQSNALFLHKQFSLKNQQQKNQQALSAVINTGNVANSFPNVFPSNVNKGNQYFSNTIKPSFEVSNQYSQNNNVNSNQFLTPTQLPSSSTFSSTPSQFDQPGRVSQPTFSLSGVSNSQGAKPSVPVPSILLLTPKEDNPVINQGVSGLTQASISPFPSTVPITSNLNKPASSFDSLSQQKNNLPTQETVGSQNNGQLESNAAVNGFSNNFAQIISTQNQGEIYEYQKPDQSLTMPFEKSSSFSQTSTALNVPTQQNNNEKIQYQQSTSTNNILQVQNNFLNRQNQEATTTSVIKNQSYAEQSKIESTNANFGPKLLPSRPQFSSTNCCSFNQNKDASLDKNNHRNQDQSNFVNNAGSVSSQSFTNKAQSVTESEKFKTQAQQPFDETGYHY